MHVKMYSLVSFILLIVLFGLSVCPVLAKHKSSSFEPPDKGGEYDDPDHPGLRVRVFAHPERPERVSNSLLSCSPDNDSSSQVLPAGWKLPSNWTYTLNSASTPSSVGSSNLATIVLNGFSDWTSVVNGKVNLTKNPVDTTSSRSSFDGKNIIAFGRAGSSLGTTYVWYYTSNSQVVDVDTIMNKKYSWRWANSNTCADNSYYDAENVMTHELGHWFGLDDEYDASLYQNATMYGYASKGEVKKNTLTTGDVNGALAIYP